MAERGNAAPESGAAAIPLRNALEQSHAAAPQPGNGAFLIGDKSPLTGAGAFLSAGVTFLRGDLASFVPFSPEERAFVTNPIPAGPMESVYSPKGEGPTPSLDAAVFPFRRAKVQKESNPEVRCTQNRQRVRVRGLIILSARGSPRLMSLNAAHWLGRRHHSALLRAVGETPLVLTIGDRRLVVTLLDHTAAGDTCLLLEEYQLDRLTQSELQILYLLAEGGYSTKKIAALRKVKPSTPKKHLENIFQKLGVNNRTAAAACLRGMRDGRDNFS